MTTEKTCRGTGNQLGNPARGPWITGSYFGDNDTEKFDEGWLRTGDVGRIDAEGYLTLTDRSKDVIKSGGEWISSVELENTLIGHLPCTKRGGRRRGR
jgi:acyl-CoA synthetase (AMP-forming)/AMP-acid ligase II